MIPRRGQHWIVPSLVDELKMIRLAGFPLRRGVLVLGDDQPVVSLQQRAIGESGFCLVGGSGKGGVQHFLHVWQRGDVRTSCFPLVDRRTPTPRRAAKSRTLRRNDSRSSFASRPVQRWPVVMAPHTPSARNIARSVVPVNCVRSAPPGHQQIIPAKPCAEQASAQAPEPGRSSHWMR
jgi:hypothetical protein